MLASPRAKPRSGRALRVVLLASSIGCLLLGCSLGNVTHDACTQTSECSALFGTGSECVGGYCTDPQTCSTDSDCKAGTCRGGYCSTGSCEGEVSGKPCFACSPVKREEFLNACTDATCVPFDAARVTKHTPGDPLPPVP